MAFITETIVFDRRLQLGNESYVRRMGFGASWSRIRIGIRFAINGRSNIFVPYLILGVCADPGSVPTNDRSNGTMGAMMQSTGGKDFLYLARQANNSYYNTQVNSFATYTKLDYTVGGATQSFIGAVGGGCSANTYEPNCFMIGLAKNNNIYTLTEGIQPTPAQAAAGTKTAAQFLVDMDNETGTGFSGLSRSTYGAALLTTHTPMPYVFVSWSKATPTIEITHIAVTRFQ